MDQAKAAEIAAQYFPNYPTETAIHITADGQAFFDKKYAEMHGKGEVWSVERGLVGGDTNQEGDGDGLVGGDTNQEGDGLVGGDTNQVEEPAGIMVETVPEPVEVEEEIDIAKIGTNATNYGKVVEPKKKAGKKK